MEKAGNAAEECDEAKKTSSKYFFDIEGNNIPDCKIFFCGVFQDSKKRVETI